jgi:hypothetical protein
MDNADPHTTITILLLLISGTSGVRGYHKFLIRSLTELAGYRHSSKRGA